MCVYREAAVILTGGTRRKIACSTLPECEMYADNGFEDILLAFPITANKIPKYVLIVLGIQLYKLATVCKMPALGHYQTLFESKCGSIFCGCSCLSENI